MIEISEAAWAKADLIAESADRALFIQQVSDAAKETDRIAHVNGFEPASALRTPLQPFILPDPVDPLVKAARQVVIDTLDPAAHTRCTCREHIAAGEWDKSPKMKIAMEALRRGMEWQGNG